MNHAEILARVTGSVSATVVNEHRDPQTGVLVVDSTEVYPGPDADDGYETDRHGGLYTHAEFDDALQALAEGLASDVWACPVDGTLQGVARRGVVRATSPNAFDGGDWVELRCGHTLV